MSEQCWGMRGLPVTCLIQTPPAVEEWNAQAQLSQLSVWISAKDERHGRETAWVIRIVTTGKQGHNRRQTRHLQQRRASLRSSEPRSIYLAFARKYEPQSEYMDLELKRNSRTFLIIAGLGVQRSKVRKTRLYSKSFLAFSFSWIYDVNSWRWHTLMIRLFFKRRNQ